MKLTIELVPSTAWYTNVRSNVSKEQWDIIRKRCYRNAHYKCEICGEKGEKWPVECHEIWEYNDNKQTQILIGFIALCPKCHKVKHAGRSQLFGEGDLVADHLKLVNNWTEEQVDVYWERVTKQWKERSKHKWKLDISYIEEYLK
jgi:5-methylcytosine-specific restriction endonuclease McrA